MCKVLNMSILLIFIKRYFCHALISEMQYLCCSWLGFDVGKMKETVSALSLRDNVDFKVYLWREFHLFFIIKSPNCNLVDFPQFNLSGDYFPNVILIKSSCFSQIKVICDVIV